ncbi:adenosine 5'-monophosphoramidase HINT3 isoform 4-T7 [Salvelinus alpinus]
MATNEGSEPEYVDISKINVGQGEGYENKCIFCKVVNNEMGTEILHVDEEVSCFRDIKPGAPHHYLVVPTRHVGNCKSLSKEHVSLGLASTGPHSVLSLTCISMCWHLPVKWASCPASSTDPTPIGLSRRTS